MVDKQDIIDSLPTTGDVLQVATGDTVSADVENVNNQALLNFITLLFQFVRDDAPSLSETNVWTGTNNFSTIKIDAIQTKTTGGDLTITTTSTGTVKVADATYVAGRVLTTTNVGVLAPSATTDMVGATGSVAGVRGLVPAPAAPDNLKFLRGDGTWAAGVADVVGPSSATDNAIARFDTTTGKLLQNSTSALDDSGYLTVNAYIAGTGFVNAQTGTTYTLAVADNGREVTCTNASAITVTVTTTSIPADYTVIVSQLGAGQVSFTAGGSTVLRNVNTQTKIAGQYGVVRIKRVGSTNDFVISGSTGT